MKGLKMRNDHGLRVVRLGLIGAGRIGTMHAGNIARHVPGAELAAVADARAEAAQQLAARYDAKARDVDSLIKDPEIDGVVITSLASAHQELIVRTAGAGKPVWCEKPASLTMDEIDRAIAATEQAGVAFQVGFNRRFARDFAAARKTIEDGGIGTPQLLRSITRDPGRRRGWARRPPGSGRGRSSARRSSTTSTRCSGSIRARGRSRSTRRRTHSSRRSTRTTGCSTPRSW